VPVRSEEATVSWPYRFVGDTTMATKTQSLKIRKEAQERKEAGKDSGADDHHASPLTFRQMTF